MLIMHNEAMFQRLADQKFDLAILDGFIFFKCTFLVPHRLGLPYVAYADEIDALVARVPWLPSFVPHYMTTYTERMTFSERLINTAVSAVSTVYNPVPDSPVEVR